MFRIAAIGPGSICRTYAEALKESKTVKLSAIAGRDTLKGRDMAAEYAVPYYTEVETMFRLEQPDAVLICTPTFTHEEMVEKALAHRIPVMCEKPFVLEAATAERLSAAAEKAQVPLMVMQVIRFWPEYVKLRELIVDGSLGTIKNVYINRLSSHPTWTEWHRDPGKSGGGLYDLNIHDIDYLYHVFGKVAEVYSAGRKEPSGCYNNVSTVIRFACGVSAVAEGFMDMTGAYPFSTNVRICGDRASVEYLNREVYLKDGRKDRADGLILYEAGKKPQALGPESYNPYRKEVEYFADCVRNHKKTDLVPSGDIIAVLKILEAITESLETGKPVSVT